MSEQLDETTDDESKNRIPVTRRQTLGALAASGALAALSSVQSQEEEDNMSIGGGPMSDAADEYQARIYRGTFAERPEPGVANRVWEVDDDGHTNHGAIYVDTGAEWELVDRQFNSVEASSLQTGQASTRTLSFRHDGTQVQASEPLSFIEPTSLSPAPGISNPVYSADEATDVTASRFVADHFILRRPGGFEMTAETLNNDTGQQYISLWTGDSPLSMGYQSIVMDDTLTGSTTLSYPLTIYDESVGEWYCCPSHGSEGNVGGIYRADTWPPSSPSDWTLVETNTWWQGDNFVWRYNDAWWAARNDRLWYNTDEALISESWTEHEQSINLRGIASGRAIVSGDVIFLPVSYDPGNDGDRVMALDAVTELTTSSVTTQPRKPDILVGGTGPATTSNWWNSKEVHHLDVAFTERGKDIWLVDGRMSTQSEWSVGAFVPGIGRMLAVSEVTGTPHTIGGGGASLGPVPLTRELDYYNTLDTTNDEVTIRQSGVYEISGFLNIDPVDSITTPFDVTYRLYDGSNNQFEDTITVTDSTQDRYPIGGKVRLRPGTMSWYITNSGDDNIDLVNPSRIEIERTATQ